MFQLFFRLVMGIPEKIKAIQDEIHKTQINKATEFHIGLLKAKMSRLKREMEENTHGKIVSRGWGSLLDSMLERQETLQLC